MALPGAQLRTDRQPPEPAVPSERPGSAEPSTDGPVTISVVITVYNEEESLPALREELVEALDDTGHTWEVVFVDDGSTDESRELQRAFCSEDPRFRSIHLRRNFGKAAALQEGFRRASGEIIVTMDADLQDDPAEITKLIAPIKAGTADLVSGWKHPRRDPLTKTVPSKLYNAVVRRTTGLSLHDANCGFKAYRAEIVRELSLYGDLHRYITVIADAAGFVVSEVKVNHRPRVHGHSKYAAGRFLRGFLDLVTVLFLIRYRRRPLHLIGTLALLMGAAGFLILWYLTTLWFAGEPIGHRPLLSLGILLLVMSGQFLTFGLLAEMLTYQFHRVHNHYPVRALHGFGVEHEVAAQDAPGDRS